MFVDNETLWRATVAMNPDSWMAHDNLGVALSQNQKTEEAIAEINKALALRPDSAETYSNLGNVLLQNGEIDEAIASYKKSLALDPLNPNIHYNLGNVMLHQKKQPDEAILHLEKCIEIEIGRGIPENAFAHYDLGVAFCKKRRFEKAVAHYRQALKILPEFEPALSKLAWILATCPESTLRNGPQALELALHSNQLAGGRNPFMLRTLAAAYAEVGQFNDAIGTAQRALSIATMMSDTSLVETLQQQIQTYQAGEPFRDESPER